ncbi:SUMF1/EgtB/PvdO family nonheme iron enzyme [Magnetococcus marinus]|nr:SUMF1/EgtB/PvdO family nonheme iron enzyme [Magnetococcus marinus]
MTEIARTERELKEKEAQEAAEAAQQEAERDRLEDALRVKRELKEIEARPAVERARLQAEQDRLERDRKKREKEAKREAELAEGYNAEQKWVGEDFQTGMEFVWVSGGSYEMGDTGGYQNEIPVHRVTLDGFWLGKYEVTQAQWRAVMGSDPSTLKGDDHPVENVSWNDVQEFIRKLNARGGGKYRLPTEAEWEYACRSGGKDRLYSGSEDLDKVAWHDEEYHPVGGKAPNGLGLYDMSGNVWEWVQDVYDEHAYDKHAPKSPIYEGSGSYRVGRGGSWLHGAGDLRCANRNNYDPGDRSNFLGFRLLRTP